MTWQSVYSLLLSFLAFWPYALGWIVGAIVRIVVFTAAAIIAGYNDARGVGGDE